MQFVSDINIPRWFGLEKQLGDRIELNIFCDASSEAYGAVAYVNYFSECPKKHISGFLLSKFRLAPIKEKSLTIPRLELQAAVLAIRLKNTISKQLDFSIDETRFWSDSQVVLKYIANKDTRFPVFVMNRLNEIRLHSTPEQWHYVPTSQNPADFCTRFVPFSKLKFHQSWLLEQQVNSISVDNDSDKLLEIEEKLTNNLVQTKVQYCSFIKWDHYS